MKDRISLLIKAKNLTAAQFADEIGVQKSSISHIISGRNNASLDFVQKILFRYPDVNMDWLMFGKGPLFLGSETTPKSSNDAGLNIESVQNKQPVDLFSVVAPDNHTEFRRENELISGLLPEITQEDTINKVPAPEPGMENKTNTNAEPKPRQESGIEFRSGHKNNSARSVIKIVEFYSDNTFKEYFPD